MGAWEIRKRWVYCGGNQNKEAWGVTAVLDKVGGGCYGKR